MEFMQVKFPRNGAIDNESLLVKKEKLINLTISLKCSYNRSSLSSNIPTVVVIECQGNGFKCNICV